MEREFVWGMPDERVAKHLGRYVERYLAVWAVDELDSPQILMAPRAEALALGISTEGELTVEVDLYELDEVMSQAIDPSLN